MSLSTTDLTDLDAADLSERRPCGCYFDGPCDCYSSYDEPDQGDYYDSYEDSYDEYDDEPEVDDDGPLWDEDCAMESSLFGDC